jgi:hypothetical protein
MYENEKEYLRAKAKARSLGLDEFGEPDCDQIAEEAIEARNDEWASHQTAIDEQYGQ